MESPERCFSFLPAAPGALREVEQVVSEILLRDAEELPGFVALLREIEELPGHMRGTACAR